MEAALHSCTTTESLCRRNAVDLRSPRNEIDKAKKLTMKAKKQTKATNKSKEIKSKIE